MINLKFRKAITAYAEENGVEIKILDNHAYDDSVLGVTEDNRIVYSYERMVQEFMQDEDCSEEEAQEWVDYNTLRALPYLGEDAPIVISLDRDRLLDFYGD